MKRPDILLSSAALLAAGAHAQALPTRILVGAPAGGSTDTLAQTLPTELGRRLDAEGAMPVGNSPEEFSRFVQGEIQRWTRVVKFSGAKPQ